jgi:hypothetical protein
LPRARAVVGAVGTSISSPVCSKTNKRVTRSRDDKGRSDGFMESGFGTGVVMGPSNVMKNASVQQPFSIEPLPPPLSSLAIAEGPSVSPTG